MSLNALNKKQVPLFKWMAVLLLLYSQFAQGQVFTSSPAVGTYVSCPSTVTCSSQPYTGGVVQMRLKAVDTNADEFDFEIRKCDGSPFSGSGTFYLYRYAVCNTYLEAAYVPAGAGSIILSYAIPPDFNAGTRSYFGYFHSDVSGQDFYAGQIDITAVTPPPQLEFQTCFSSPSTIEMYDDLNVSYSVENTGLTTWYGYIKTILYDPSNSNTALELDSKFTVIGAGEIYSLSTGNVAVDLPPGNYRIISSYSNAPNGGYDVPTAGSCSPTMLAAGTGTTTHYRPLTIQAPCSEGATIQITNPGPGAIYHSGLITINWSGSQQGSNCEVKVYYTLNNGAPQIIAAETNDDGNTFWGISTSNINSNSVRVGVEYLKPDSNGNTVGDLSAPFSIFTDLYAPAHSSPADGTVFPSGTSSVTLNWIRNNPAGAATYEVKIRDLTTDQIVLDYYNVGDTDSYTYASSNLIDGHEYRWVVRATNPTGTAEYDVSTFSIGNFGLELDAPLGFGTDTLIEGQSYTFNTVIKNLGTSSWSGALALKINNVLPTIDLGYHTIPAGGSLPISHPFTPDAAHVGSQVPVQGLYQNFGLGDYYTVNSIFHDNPRMIEIIGSGLTIQYPNGQEAFEVGEVIQQIAWTTQGVVGNISLELVTSTGIVQDTIADNVVNQSPWPAFSIPVDVPPGPYRIKIYETATGNFADFSDTPFSITSPGSFNLELYTGITTVPSPLQSGEDGSISATVTNNGALTWNGNLEMVLQDLAGVDLDVLDAGTAVQLQPGATFTLLRPTATISLAPGAYRILIRWRSNPTDNWTPVFSGIFQNPLNLSILDPLAGCTITNPPPAETERYEAVQYLCINGIIDQPADGDAHPNAFILKEDMAKITFLALFGEENAATPADYFPVPFGDMQDQPNQAYARYGKVLSYLQYGDAQTPFDRRFFNYNPASPLTRGQVCKVLVEAFNLAKDVIFLPFTDVPSAHPEFLHIAKLTALGVVNGNQNYFRPDDPATRADAFLLLYRLLDQCPTCTIPTPAAADFFTPGNYAPSNLNLHPGAADANFEQYRQRSFFIPGRGLNLEFEHFYNSYLTELPDELFGIWQSGSWQSFRPLGPGWSHSYNAYLVEIQGWSHNGMSQADLSVICWPDGRMQVYEKNGSQLSAITEGLYQEVNYDSGTGSYTVTGKDQVAYHFEQKNTNNADWPLVLTSITDRNNNQIQLHYEPFSGAGLRLKEVTGPAGRKLKWSYYPNSSRVHKVEDPLGRTVTFTFGGPSGADLQSYRDADNYQTLYNYSSAEGEAHLLRSITLPNGNFIFNDYEDRKLRSSSLNNSSNGVIRQQDIAWGLNTGPQGGTTSSMTVQAGAHSYTYGFEKNALGRLTQLTAPVADATFSYGDPLHPTLPTMVTLNDLNTSYSYDALGNVLQVDQEMNTVHQFTYTALNDLQSYTDPMGHTTTYAYTNGNLSMITAPIGTTTLSHNAYGQVKTSTNPEGITTTFEYNNYGQVKAIKLPLGINHLRSYDAAGRATSLTDANGQQTTVEYNGRDFVRKLTNPFGQVTEYVFDGNRNLTEVINAQGNSTLLTYNYFDWLQAVSFGGDSKQFVYDPEGKLAKLTKPDGTELFYTYLSNGNLANNGYATFTYDAKNRLKTVAKDGQSLSFNYDDLNRLTSTGYAGQTVAYQYDQNSNLKKLIYPGNKAVDYTYDANNRLKTVKDWNNQQTTYHYFDDGRLEQIDYPNGTTSEYFYDAAGRLDSLVHSSGSTILAAYQYTLDPQGNIVSESKTEPFSLPGWSATASSSSFNNDNTLAAVDGQNYNYNPNGALTGLPNRSITWDEHDMPVSISGDLSAAFAYDGLGNRRSATVDGITRRFVLDLLGTSRVLLEMDVNNNPLHYYIYGLDLIARIAPDNTTHYYHGDFRGSTIAMTNGGGAVTHSYQYGPYGQVLQKQEPDVNPFQFGGKFGVMADASDLYYMRARYYDPVQGRFLSEDPIWGTNLYKYAGNNPITFTDPKGTLSQALAGMVVGGATTLPASLGDALESTVFFVEGMKYAFKGDYHTANALLDEANSLIWKANARIVTGMAQGALEGTLTKGYSNANGTWLTPWIGKTGTLGNSKLLPTLSRYAIDMRTAQGIFLKNFADSMLEDQLMSAFGLDPFDPRWQHYQSAFELKP